ncbi:transporter substrate-binding domain-containing protein [Pseudomonas sp. CAU 1711]|uniref:substrate-binding periplasmic protein n=1 Tax=Pseudomonas sp. CAU 1711 TaxID=3140356 RepID=UPI0032608D3D
MRAWGVCLLLLLLWQSPLRADELLLLTEEAPPTSFLRDGLPDGYAVEVVRELIRRTGSRAHVELLPWTRAYSKAKSEANTGLFLVVRTAEREALFQWVGPILRGSTRFYSLKDSGLQVDSLEQAASAGTIAMPKQWYTYETLQRMGFDNLYGAAGPRQMVTMLKHGRVKLIATEDLTLREELASGGLTPEEVQAHMVFMRSDHYIVFSPQTEPALVERWRHELDGMRHDGSLRSILARWLPGATMP